MKRFLRIAVLLLWVLPLSRGLAENPEELFSAQATVTEVNLEEKFFRAKVEGGLELTFQVEESTQIQAAETPQLLADLTPGTAVEIQYRYNQDFEKVAARVSLK